MSNKDNSIYNNETDNESDKCLDRNCWRNRGRLYRYFAMVNISCLGLGAFVCFDAVGALQKALMDRFQISFSEFSLMYSVNSWPNMFLSLVGGFLIDRVFGIKIGAIFYASVFFIGHMIFSSGVILQVYWCALLGRFICGFGEEFLFICMQIYSIQYFKGKELSMVVCINISVARLGSSIVYAIADPILTNIRKIVPGNEDVGIVMYIVGSFSLLPIISSIILASMTPRGYEAESSSEKKNKVKMKLIDYVIFPVEYWIILLLQMGFTVFVYVFLPFTQEFFKTTFGMTVDSANAVTSFFSIIGAVIAPFVGILLDKLGRGIIFSHASMVLALIAHFILGFSGWTPYLSMFILSLSYAFFNGSVVPMLAFIVPEHRLGTAYGVGLAIVDGFYSLTMYIAGVVIDSFSYLGLEVYMLGFVLGGLMASISLWIVNHKNKGILNATPSQRNARLEKLKNDNTEVKQPLGELHSDSPDDLLLNAIPAHQRIDPESIQLSQTDHKLINSDR